MRITPDELRTAGRDLHGLADAAHRMPALGGGAASNWLGASALSDALIASDSAANQAREVLSGRFREFAKSLETAAGHAEQCDVEAAARLEACGDLNTDTPAHG